MFNIAHLPRLRAWSKHLKVAGAAEFSGAVTPNNTHLMFALGKNLLAPACHDAGVPSQDYAASAFNTPRAYC